MFTMGDGYEKKDHLLGQLYPRSLLYFISGVLEKDPDVPILGMQRFLSGTRPFDAPALKQIDDFLESAGSDRLVLSVTPAGVPVGLRSGSRRHVDFDDDLPTLESLKEMIRA